MGGSTSSTRSASSRTGCCGWGRPSVSPWAGGGGEDTAPSAAELWFLVRLLDYVEPGLMAIARDILEAQTRPGAFTRRRNGGEHLRLDATARGMRVTHTRTGCDWAIMTPGVRGGVRCWHVTVHTGRDIIVGIIGTADPGGADVSFDHATAHGWGGWGSVYRAGQHQRGGWPGRGWRDSDEAAVRVDCAAGTLTLRHRRLGKTFTIPGLQRGVEEWFINASLANRGESVEVRPLATEDFDAFLQ